MREIGRWTIVHCSFIIVPAGISFIFLVMSFTHLPWPQYNYCQKSFQKFFSIPGCKAICIIFKRHYSPCKYQMVFGFYKDEKIAQCKTAFKKVCKYISLTIFFLLSHHPTLLFQNRSMFLINVTIS